LPVASPPRGAMAAATNRNALPCRVRVAHPQGLVARVGLLASFLQAPLASRHANWDTVASLPSDKPSHAYPTGAVGSSNRMAQCRARRAGALADAAAEPPAGTVRGAADLRAD